MKYFVKLAPNI